jgi:signal transduction histidine kinase
MLITFSVFILSCFVVMIIAQAAKDFNKGLEQGKQNAYRQTKMLAEEVELTFLAVDLSLRRAVEKQYFNTMFGGNLPEFIKNNFVTWVNETPHLASMMMVNEQGVIEVAAHKKEYEKWLDYARNLAGEPAFETLKDASDKSFYLGQLDNDENPQKMIIMSRKISKVDGSFGGVVMVAVDPNFYLEFFKSVDFKTKHNDDSRYMTILHTNRSNFISSPNKSGSMLDVINHIFDNELETSARSEVISGNMTVDNSVKVYSYKRLKNLPVVAAVVIDEQDFLMEWREGRVKDIGFLAIFTVFGSVLSFFALTMAKQIVRVEESEGAAVLASQAQAEFLANMSHELRTPLNAIIGFSEMLNSGYFGPLNAKQKERVHDINLCGSHLLQLIGDILEFSKGDAGKLELNEERVDMNEIVGECVRMMSEKMKSKSINLVLAIEKNIPKIWADKRKVRQILLNLMSNSLKFTPEDGSIKISVKQDQFGNMNMIVSDTGIGIAEEDIPTALSVFGQVHRSQSHEGTGLGLPLCKMFTELHGGKLALVSALGEGTTVRIILPAQRIITAAEEVDNDLKEQNVL